MQASKFHNLIGKLICEQGATRMTVCIDKSSFQHALESDGCVILEVCGVEVRNYPMMDDDGGVKILKDGSESRRTSIVIYGNAYEPKPAGDH